jgi:hypothetical protein
VTYTDTTTSVFTQSLSDWFVPQNYPGESKAIPMAYRDASNGTQNPNTYYLFGYSFTLNSAKTVSSITLPNNNNVIVVAITLTSASTSPDFSISAGPASQSVTQGGAAGYTATVTALNGFSGSVSLSAGGLPTGATASFNPTSVTGSGPSTVTISTLSTTPVGSYPVTITGTSGALLHTANVTLVVTATPDFSISAGPASQSVTQGSAAGYTATVTALNGFSGSVSLSAGGLPTGATASFNPTSVTGSGPSTVTISTLSTTPVGSYPVTITGTAGALQHSTSVTLVVSGTTSSGVQVNLGPYYNVSGIFTDGTTFPITSGLDRSGHGYSANLLGSVVNFQNTSMAIGPANVPNAVTSTTVVLPAGQFSSLAMLATGVNGLQTSQTFTVTYTDSTTSVFTQSLSDWFVPQNYPGESKAIPMAYRDASNGTQNPNTYYLFGYSFALNNAKTVSSITLPFNNNVAVIAITLNP